MANLKAEEDYKQQRFWKHQYHKHKAFKETILFLLLSIPLGFLLSTENIPTWIAPAELYKFGAFEIVYLYLFVVQTKKGCLMWTSSFHTQKKF